MKAIRLHGKAATEADIKGRVLVHDLGPELRKGSILRAGDLPRVQQTGEIHVGYVPPYSVVVAGTLPGKPLPEKDYGPSLYCAVIVKKVDAQTRSKTSINELLRD